MPVSGKWSKRLKPTNRIIGVLLAGVLASALVSYLVSHHVLRPAAAREEAFDAIVSGQLKPDQTGTIPLPDRWKVASVDGNAYVTGDRDRTMWVLFVVEKGHGPQLHGYLFCTKPAAAQATGLIVVNYPNPAGPTSEVTIQRVMTASSFEVVNQKKGAATSRP
jgi:hypothetical protein